jgi:endo-1,4-beta-D-glucanase Y
MVPAMPATRLLAGILLLTAACAARPAPIASVAAPAAPGVAHPFGSRPLQYPAGSIRPAGGQAALDAAVAAAYDRWKAAYVATACGGHYVKSPGEQGQIASSSGNAAGMIITAFMAGHDPEARTIYDGILTLSRKFPSYLEHRAGNLSYAIVRNPDGSCAHPRDKKGNNTGDSSVNGDLDFGFALLLGERQWSDARYGSEAKKTIATIRQYDFNPTSHVPLIGDWASLPGEPEEWKTSGKTSNFMLGHFRAFAQADDRPFWNETVEKLHALTEATVTRHSPAAGLLPLYLRYGTTPPPAKMLGDQHAGHFVKDAGSIPFRLAADVLASGDPRSRAALARMLAFVQKAAGGDPARIVDGYNLDGSALASAGTVKFIAPFGSAAIFDAANQAWLDATWKLMLAAPAGEQEADTENLLNMILISGNWWQP